MKKIEGLTDEDKKSVIGLLEMANPQTRTTIKDIRQIDKIITVVEASGDILELEDADYEFAKARINGIQAWIPKNRKEVIALADKLGL